MKRSPLNSALADLNRKMDQCLSLANDVRKFKEYKRKKYISISKPRKRIIVELSFLQLSNAWEAFLEDTFINYMCGHKTQSGFSPILLMTLRTNTLQQASSILNQGKPYSDWNRGDAVIQRAKIFFKDGEPYYFAIANSRDKLEEIRKIRNGIAHSSAHAREKLKEVIRQQIGYMPRYISPGEFLMQSGSNSSQSRLQEYGLLLKLLATHIVH